MESQVLKCLPQSAVYDLWWRRELAGGYTLPSDAQGGAEKSHQSGVLIHAEGNTHSGKKFRNHLQTHSVSTTVDRNGLLHDIQPIKTKGLTSLGRLLIKQYTATKRFFSYYMKNSHRAVRLHVCMQSC